MDVEGTAARTVGNAMASTIRANVEKAAAGAREIAQTPSQAATGPAAAGAMEALATTGLGAAERAGVQHAAEIMLRAERVTAIQGLKTQTTEQALSS
jgi:hypothetical protein